MEVDSEEARVPGVLLKLQSAEQGIGCHLCSAISKFKSEACFICSQGASHPSQRHLKGFLPHFIVSG